MKHPDLISSLFWIVLALCLIIWGYALELGTLSEPESGFIIFWAGIIMLGLSGAVFIMALREKDKRLERSRQRFGASWRNVIWVTIALALYAYLLSPLGFLVDTFLLLFFLFRVYEPRKWPTTIWVSALMVIVTYLVFDVWLGSQLPK